MSISTVRFLPFSRRDSDSQGADGGDGAGLEVSGKRESKEEERAD